MKKSEKSNAPPFVCITFYIQPPLFLVVISPMPPPSGFPTPPPGNYCTVPNKKGPYYTTRRLKERMKVFNTLYSLVGLPLLERAYDVYNVFVGFCHFLLK